MPGGIVRRADGAVRVHGLPGTKGLADAGRLFRPGRLLHRRLTVDLSRLSVTTAGATFCGPSAASALTGISDNTSTSDKKLDNIRFFISRSSCYDFPDRELELTGPILFPFFQRPPTAFQPFWADFPGADGNSRTSAAPPWNKWRPSRYDRWDTPAKPSGGFPLSRAPGLGRGTHHWAATSRASKYASSSVSCHRTPLLASASCF